ncbi:hypothetical protein GDO81_007917 [Engystomops pustulosus]|uniref:Inhibitor of Bruton tyrosine kinase n=1 Tax=Engystomops pustulosus TaxID=76066 RepID=A0AAV7CBV8_ENGPU|nr:hypothetical protein GDO81_007917 [Engystomops pustulosus]
MMVLCKFHSVFLSQKGQVYTCGHGQGGRLGHGDEVTCLVPRLVEGLSTHSCSQVAAAKDHTVVLTEDGYVYSFGLNTFHQLGILSSIPNCSVPRQVQAKTLKGKTVIGVAAGRFHTVLWTKDAVYTMGLNGGQLGYLLDPHGEKLVSCPRQVSALHHKDVNISLVSASDGATVCVTDRGDIYLLTEYQCKKLASKQLNLKKVLVSGGFLDCKVDAQTLKDKGGQPVRFLALDQAGRVFCWKSTNSSMKPCRWVYGRQVFVSDFALNKNGMLLITSDGEGFSGKWVSEKKKGILDGVRCENGTITVVHKKSGNRPRFNMKKCKESANVEFICKVLVMADQYLVFVLKEFTLKNAAELLEFAALYNAAQLKVSCFQFIGLNMVALLESRSLDILSEDVLKELADYYRKMIPAMDKRLITPYLDGPDISTLEYEDGDSFMSCKDDIFSEQSTPEVLFKKAKAKAKRKPRKRSDSSGGYNLSDIIHSPPSSGFFKSEKNNSVESLQDLVTSDSEGSFVGASSPRDLQSPDFTATFSPRKNEERNRVYDASPVTSPPAVTGSTGIKHVFSSPKAIPNTKVSPAYSQNWVTVTMSPISPQAVDLRTIMKTEENIQKTQKTAAHGVKLSQKQRKMMALSSKEINTTAESVSNRSTLATNIKSPPKTWRPPETMANESKWKTNVPQPESSNPWLLSLNKKQPSVVPVTFTTIVEEEKMQEAALIRSREKPLALIQIEERAILDLLVHYQAIDNPEEYITVERAAQGPMATPMWNKH